MNPLHLNLQHLMSTFNIIYIIIYNVTYIQVINSVNLPKRKEIVGRSTSLFFGLIEEFGDETTLFVRKQCLVMSIEIHVTKHMREGSNSA